VAISVLAQNLARNVEPARVGFRLAIEGRDERKNQPLGAAFTNELRASSINAST
jgi:hypothetical protein